MTRRKEQAESTRARLVDAAIARFVAQGYEGTSISEILADTGLAKGALYHHFPDGKRGLFMGAVDALDTPFHEGIDEILRTIASPLAQIAEGFALLMRLATDPAFARVILVEAELVNPGGWAEGGEYVLLKAALEQAIAMGEIGKVPLDAATSSLYGAARRSADLVARAADPAAVADQCLDVLHRLLLGLRAN